MSRMRLHEMLSMDSRGYTLHEPPASVSSSYKLFAAALKYTGLDERLSHDGYGKTHVLNQDKQTRMPNLSEMLKNVARIRALLKRNRL